MLGWEEVFLVLVVMLLIFGPNKLPEMARTLGSAYKEFQNATANVQREARVLQNTLTAPTPIVQPPAPGVSAETTEVTPPAEQPVEQVAAETTTATSKKPEDENIKEIAKIMGIATEGKTTEQLRAEVRDNLGKSDMEMEVK